MRPSAARAVAQDAARARAPASHAPASRPSATRAVVQADVHDAPRSRTSSAHAPREQTQRPSSASAGMHAPAVHAPAQRPSSARSAMHEDPPPERRTPTPSAHYADAATLAPKARAYVPAHTSAPSPPPVPMGPPMMSGVSSTPGSPASTDYSLVVAEDDEETYSKANFERSMEECYENWKTTGTLSMESLANMRRDFAKVKGYQNPQTLPARRTTSQRSPETDEEEEASKLRCSAGRRPPTSAVPQQAAKSYADTLQKNATTSHALRTETTTEAVPLTQKVNKTYPPEYHGKTGTTTSPVSPTRSPTRNVEEMETGPETYPPKPRNTGETDSAPIKKKRYPPLVVEELPNWTTHFKTLKEKIGRPASARPYGMGVRFTPADGEEYRIVQRYLESVEPKLSWFSYSLPQDKDVKVAVRGLLANTEPEEVQAELLSRGFQAEYVRRIRARKGRPGCLFFVILKKTPETTPAIYEIKELLSMTGIAVEPWRGKKGPAQCHRCQQFRHSSHCCHRKLACVRCGDEHTARDCPRPLSEPATCANCKGPHPASSMSCPVKRREMRNKRAGTVPLTGPTPKTTTMPRTTKTQDVQEHAPSTLMAPANGPTSRTGNGRRRRRPRPPRTQAANEQKEPAEQRTANKPKPKMEKEKLATVQMAIETLQSVLEAIQNGDDPVPVILRGITELISNKYK